MSACHSAKTRVKSNWEVSHSGLLNENKGVLVSPVKAAKPQVRQLLCFCVQSFSLSPWSFVPAYVSFMLMTFSNDFSRQKGKQQHVVFRWKKVVCVSVIVSTLQHKSFCQWFYVCWFVTFRSGWEVLSGVLYVRQSQDAQRSARQWFRALQNLHVVRWETHPAVWLTTLVMMRDKQGVNN